MEADPLIQQMASGETDHNQKRELEMRRVGHVLASEETFQCCRDVSSCTEGINITVGKQTLLLRWERLMDSRLKTIKA